MKLLRNRIRLWKSRLPLLSAEELHVIKILQLVGITLLVVSAIFIGRDLWINANSEQALFMKDNRCIFVKSFDTTIYKIEELNTAYIITYSKGGVVLQIDNNE